MAPGAEDTKHRVNSGRGDQLALLAQICLYKHYYANGCRMLALETVLGSRINIQILRYLLAVRGGLSGNEIATRLGLQQSSARQALERLVAARIVTRLDIGRSAAYELDRELAFTDVILAPLFKSEMQLRDELLEGLAKVCGALGSELEAAILFGSLARNDRDFRDADLLFVVSNKKYKAQLHDRIAGHFEPLQRRFAAPVSAVVATEAELRSARYVSVVDAVCREGLILFGSPGGLFKNVQKRSVTSDERA